MKLGLVDRDVHRRQSSTALAMLSSDLLVVTRRVGTEVHMIYEYIMMPKEVPCRSSRIK